MMLSNNVVKPATKILLAVDLDGTLLTDSEKITTRTLSDLRRIQDLGVELCVATGRNFDSARKFIVEYGLKAHLICANGALIKDPYSLKEYYFANVNVEEAKKIYEYADELASLIYIFTDGGWYVNKINDKVLRYSEYSDYLPMMISDIKKWEELKIIKIVLVDIEEKKDLVRKRIEKNCKTITVASSDPYSIDITDKKATKGNGLKILAKALGIERENIIAIGNYFNDIEMFKAAKISIAMENSPDEVKEKADYITSSNEDEGVSKAIKKFILKEPI